MDEREEQGPLQSTSQLSIRGAAESKNMDVELQNVTSREQGGPPDTFHADVPQASTSTATLEDTAVEVLPSTRPTKPWGLAAYGIPPPPEDLQPDPAVEAKLRHFHALRAQGVHFNDSLQSNKSFRNPSILSKLVNFVNVDEKLSAMPNRIWSSSHGVSSDAWAETIAEKQKQLSEDRQRAQERGKRTAIDFALPSSSSRPKERLQTRDGRAGTSTSSKDDRKRSRWDKDDNARRSEGDYRRRDRDGDNERYGNGHRHCERALR